MNQKSFMEKLLDGVEVEWKSVSDVFYLRNGYTPSKSKKEFWNNVNRQSTPSRKIKKLD